MLFIVCSLLCMANAHAQSGSAAIQPIESETLQGPRQATDAEKEYARSLAADREQQAQIDMNLPAIDRNGQVQTPANIDYYPLWNGYYGWNTWRLHKGLNVNIGASAFVTSGSGYGTHAGFTQDINLMYVTNLSRKATLAIGGYFNNMEYRGDNYTTAGLQAILGYQFNEHWSAYAFVQKAFTSGNIYPRAYSPYWGGYYGLPYGYGYVGAMGWGYGGNASRMMDRIGAGVRYQWGEYNQNSIEVNVEVDHMPQPRSNGVYNLSRYDYPVR